MSVHNSLSPDSRADDVLVPDLSKKRMRQEFLPEEKQAMFVKRAIGKFATGREWSLQKKGTVSASRFLVDETHEWEQIAEDRREVLVKSPKAKAAEDTSAVIVDNPFRLIKVLGSN